MLFAQDKRNCSSCKTRYCAVVTKHNKKLYASMKNCTTQSQQYDEILGSD